MANIDPHYSGGLAVAAYDLFHGGGMLAGDVDFYLDCARRFGEPILEVGAGTGRILLPLAVAGHEVVGLDISAAMLAIARKKITNKPDVADRIRLVEADVTDFDLKR